MSVAMSISPRDGRLKVQSVFLGFFFVVPIPSGFNKEQRWTEIPSFFPGSADFTKKKSSKVHECRKKKKESC